jgi:4-hydroxy-tetrahydrodipicolinate synthase
MNLEMIKNKIAGPVFPIVTPFKKNYDLDLACVKNYIDFLYAGGARIFHVMVHTSRFGLLDYDEMLQLNATVATYVKLKYSNSAVIVADPLYKSTASSVEFAKKAADAGADIIGLIFLERYYYDDQVYQFFETVAGACEIGILIHEQQLNTIHGTKLIPYPIDLLNRIAEIDNIIAIKEDAKKDAYTEQVIAKVKDKLAIIVSGGSKEQFLQFAPSGCQAYLVGVASFDPTCAIRFYDSYLSGDISVCRNIINTIERPFFAVAKSFGWHIALKSAMDLLGVMNRTERPPLRELPEKEHAAIAKILREIGYKPNLS